jgi:hypothetical protein
LADVVERQLRLVVLNGPDVNEDRDQGVGSGGRDGVQPMVVLTADGGLGVGPPLAHHPAHLVVPEPVLHRCRGRRPGSVCRVGAALTSVSRNRRPAHGPPAT